MIIGYIHISQTSQWKESFLLLWNQIIASGLYDEATEIRCTVLNDSAVLIEDDIFNDPKLKIIHIGYSYEYERPTLLHMHDSAKHDKEDTRYFYFYLKGINWKQESFVLDFTNTCLHYNLRNWKDAVSKLQSYDLYGCNYYPANNIYSLHYSGNLFWTKSSYLKRLSKTIGKNYVDIQNWIYEAYPIYFNAFHHGLKRITESG
jgi:hypothetical protein